MAREATLRPEAGGHAHTRRTRRLRTVGIALIALSVASFASIGGVRQSVEAAASVRGVDVSHWQGTIDWNAVARSGIKFAYMKATEGTHFKDSRFSANYTNSYRAGILRGAYHFALPDRSSGAAQADFFINNGGGWSADGKTMPGMLDLEWNPHGSDCFGLSQTQMRAWIHSFQTRYHQRTGRWAPIYTNINWWNPCVGHYPDYGDKAPMWIARYRSDPGPVPSGWATWTFWQYTSQGRVPGVAGDVDMNHFNGSYERLKVLALGREPGPTKPPPTKPPPTAPPTTKPPTTAPPTTAPTTTAPPSPTADPPTSSPPRSPTARPTTPTKTPGSPKPTTEPGTSAPATTTPGPTAPPASPPTNPGDKLPVTGSGVAGAMVGLSVALLLTGMALIVLARRRRLGPEAAGDVDPPPLGVVRHWR